MEMVLQLCISSATAGASRGPGKPHGEELAGVEVILSG